MRTVSTGVGLCVLGVCVLGAAALSSPHLGNSANAAGGAQRTPPAVGTPRHEQPPMPKDSGASNANLTDCDVRVERWFSPVPHIVENAACVDPRSGWWEVTEALPMYQPQDLLGDGKVKRLAVFGLVSFQEQFRIDVMEFHQKSDGNTRQSRIRILSAVDDPELFQNLAALGVTGVYDLDRNNGWADMDGDGDLDFAISAWGINGSNETTTVWLENIAGGSTSANAFDLDHDGHVNTADISLLLLNFD